MQLSRMATAAVLHDVPDALGLAPVRAFAEVVEERLAVDVRGRDDGNVRHDLDS